MKELDKSKVYDLRNAKKKHLKEVLKWLRENDKGWEGVPLQGFINYRFLWYNKVKEEWFNEYFVNTTDVTPISELFTQEWEPKQGEKVLVSDDEKNWYERVFALKYKDVHQCEGQHEETNLVSWTYIKPFQEEIKISDWVKRDNNTIFKVREHHDLNYINKVEYYIKITDKPLIELLNKQL